MNQYYLPQQKQEPEFLIDEDFLRYTCRRQRVDGISGQTIRDACRIFEEAFHMEREDLRYFDLKAFLEDMERAQVTRRGKTFYRLKEIGSYERYKRPYAARFI